MSNRETVLAILLVWVTAILIGACLYEWGFCKGYEAGLERAVEIINRTESEVSNE